MLANNEPMNHCLNRLHELMESAAFHRDSDENDSWKIIFTELIIDMNELLMLSQKRGHHLDFTDAVGVRERFRILHPW